MRRIAFLSANFLFLLIFSASALAEMKIGELQSLADNFLKKYGAEQHFSNVALSVRSAEFNDITTVYSGTTEFSGTMPVGANHLYQIGSITKSFIAAVLLQLEADPKFHFSIDDKLIKFLPQYPKWGDVTIKQLLNMTSRIPNYTEDKTFAEALRDHPEKEFSPEEILKFVYDQPMQTDKNLYYYSNTNYVLAGMVISKLTGHSVEEEMSSRFFTKNNSTGLALQNTFYVAHRYPINIVDRLVHGYAYHIKQSYFQPGTDITNYSVSWAGAAGANVSNTEDVLRWAEALYTVNQVLSQKQLTELTSAVSVHTGLPITKFTEEDSDGFGLGVGVSYDAEHPQDLIYNYEGGTLGYRAFYIFVPTQHIVISAAVNSMVDAEDDHLGELVGEVYELLRKKT